MFNCKEDIFTLNATDGSEDGITYSTDDSQPIIIYSENKDALKTFSFNISDRFKQIGNSSICPFTDFRIDYVLIE